jgi:YhcH/YjgK/YiaL family protein
MAVFGSVASVRAQLPSAPKFACAFAYLDALLRAGGAVRLCGLPVGESARVELEHGVHAMEQTYRSKLRPEGFFESHRRYLDIQVVVEGEEWLEVAEVGGLAVRTPYQSDRDLVAYEDFAGASLLHLRAGEAAVLFPADGHMPGLAGPAAPAVVRKTVLKVPVG